MQIIGTAGAHGAASFSAKLHCCPDVSTLSTSDPDVRKMINSSSLDSKSCAKVSSPSTREHDDPVPLSAAHPDVRSMLAGSSTSSRRSKAKRSSSTQQQQNITTVAQSTEFIAYCRDLEDPMSSSNATLTPFKGVLLLLEHAISPHLSRDEWSPLKSYVDRCLAALKYHPTSTVSESCFF